MLKHSKSNIYPATFQLSTSTQKINWLACTIALLLPSKVYDFGMTSLTLIQMHKLLK